VEPDTTQNSTILKHVWGGKSNYRDLNFWFFLLQNGKSNSEASIGGRIQRHTKKDARCKTDYSIRREWPQIHRWNHTWGEGVRTWNHGGGASGRHCWQAMLFFSRDGSRAAALLQAAYIRDAIGFTVPVCGREWTMASWSDCRQCSEIRVDEGPDPGRERCRSWCEGDEGMPMASFDRWDRLDRLRAVETGGRTCSGARLGHGGGGHDVEFACSRCKL
jgi:hypothetical protein